MFIPEEYTEDLVEDEECVCKKQFHKWNGNKEVKDLEVLLRQDVFCKCSIYESN